MGSNLFLMMPPILLGMSRLTSAVKAAALIIAVLISGSVTGIVYAEQRPGEGGYYTNSNGHRVPSPIFDLFIQPPNRQPCRHLKPD